MHVWETKVQMIAASLRRVAAQRLYARVGEVENFVNLPLSELLDFDAFCALEPEKRAQSVLRHSTPDAVVSDVRSWMALVSVRRCLPSATSVRLPASSSTASERTDTGLEAAAGLKSNALAEEEEVIMKALLSCLTSSGWETSCFEMLSNIVHASSPVHPPAQRIIKSSITLLEFIIGSVYSDDQRCQAVDIFDSVDKMYSCIPKADAHKGKEDVAKWNELQRQADNLEKHLTCVELLKKHKIAISLSFADLKRGHTNESIAVRSMWNLFRVLGAKYRPAIFWREFKQELIYMHQEAFAAISTNSVYEMYMRCLAEQEHWEVMSSVAEDWAGACTRTEVAGSLVSLAQELVNSSPALRHSALDKARRVLKCVPQADTELSGLAQAEVDFIKACELLHDLVRFQPRQNTASRLKEMREELKTMNPFATLSQVVGQKTGAAGQQRTLEPEVTTGESTSGGGGAGVHGGAEGFPIDGPMQLRLQLHQPLRVVTDLLEYNPPVMLESESLHKLLSLLGLGPTSSCWAEVMAMCAAAHVLNGNRTEALNITEKLLANAHPASWKLALALASDSSGFGAGGDLLNLDHRSDLLADAAKVCPAEDLPRLLQHFAQGPPACGPVAQDEESSLLLGKDRQQSILKSRCGYARDDVQTSSLGLLMRQKLGLEGIGAEDTSSENTSSGNWRGLPLWKSQDADWTKPSALRKWGETLLHVDSDLGMVLLDRAGALPDVLPQSESQPSRLRVAQSSGARAPAAADSAAAPWKALDSLAQAGATPAPRQALDSLARGSATPAPRDALDILTRGANAAPVSREVPAPRDALEALTFGAAEAPSQRGAPAPRDALDHLAQAGAAAPPTRQTVDSLASSTTEPRRALDSLARGSSATAPSLAQDSPGETSERPAPRSALDSLAASAEPAKSSWGFGGLSFSKVTGGLSGGLTSLMKAMEVPPPELGGEVAEDTSSHVPEPMPDVPEEAGSLRSIAARLLEKSGDADEDTDAQVTCDSPDCQVLLSCLEALQSAGVGLSQRHRPLSDEVLRWVDVNSAPELIRAVAGVNALYQHGVTPSRIALRALKQHLAQLEGDTCGDGDIAALVQWLSPADAAELLNTVMRADCKLSGTQQMEVISHVREACPLLRHAGSYGPPQLEEVVRQADALCLLRSVYQNVFGESAVCSLEICIDAPARVIGSRWVQQLSSNARTKPFAELTASILEERGIAAV